MKESANTKHIKRKREQGLCGYMGCHKTSKSYYCEELHQAQMSLASRRYYFKSLGKPMPEVKRGYKKLD